MHRLYGLPNSLSIVANKEDIDELGFSDCNGLSSGLLGLALSSDHRMGWSKVLALLSDN